MLFKTVQYRNLEYPDNITPCLEEISAHFDVDKIKPKNSYSLHTEYSFDKRKLNSKLIEKFIVLKNSNLNGIPKLWFSKEWSEEFSAFLIELTKNHNQPEYIEVHPPFSDYTDLNGFIETYKPFEELMNNASPNTQILLENRYGTFYKKGKFLISDIDQLLRFAEMVDRYNLGIRIALDIPQLFSASKVDLGDWDKLDEIFNKIAEIREKIFAIHLWGKTINGASHIGNLDTLFKFDYESKNYFLSKFAASFSDGKIRYLLLEINSGTKDLIKILNDLQHFGAKFINC